MKKNILCVSILCGFGLMLTACGSGSTSSTTASTTSATFSGTAAVGTPIVGGTVSLVCANGVVATTAQSASDGSYSLSASGITLPCALQVSGGTLGVNGATNSTPYFSVATIGGGTTNITPITSLVVANLLGTTPSAASLSASTTQIAGITTANITASIAKVGAMFPSLPSFASTNNPITSAFTPIAGNALDDSLTAVTTALANTNVAYATLVSASATATPTAPTGVTAAVATVVSHTQGLGGAAPVGSSTTPITTTYFDLFYHQDVTGTVASTTSKFIDNGINNAGSVTYGVGAALQTSAFTPTSAGGYNWGSPISYGMGFNSNYADANVPAVAEICQVVSNHNGTYQKSVDVLIENSALPITTAAGLAGITFTQYYEDCGNSPIQTNNAGTLANATGIAATMAFDANGNLSGNNTATASQVNSFLTGAVTVPSSSTTTYGGGIVSYNAFKYTTAAGQTKYALVIHGAPTPGTGLTTSGYGFTGLWLQP